MKDFLERLRANVSYRRYFNAQVEVIGREINGKFLEEFEKLVYEYVNGSGDDPYERGLLRVDALGGESEYRRYPIDKKLSDVIHMSHTGIACGVKVVVDPTMRLSEWEKWEDGYIEAFIRMDTDPVTRTESGQSEWFFWGYLPVSYLGDLMDKFKFRDLTHYYV